MKPIKGFEDYYICKCGTVFSCLTNKWLKPGKAGKSGHLFVALRKDNKYHNSYVHRLVAETYIPNYDNLPIVEHIDDNRLNNHVSNLKWSTIKDNNLAAVANGIKNAVEGSCNNRCLYLGDTEYTSIKEAARLNNISYGKLRNALCKNNGFVDKKQFTYERQVKK